MRILSVGPWLPNWGDADEEVDVFGAPGQVHLRQVEEGITAKEVCRKAWLSIQIDYRWRQKHGRLMPSEVKRLKQLEEEGQRLKKLVAAVSLDKVMLRRVIRRIL